MKIIEPSAVLMRDFDGNEVYEGDVCVDKYYCTYGDKCQTLSYYNFIGGDKCQTLSYYNFIGGDKCQTKAVGDDSFQYIVTPVRRK